MKISNPIIFVNPDKPGKFQFKDYNVYFPYYIVNFLFTNCSFNWNEHVKISLQIFDHLFYLHPECAPLVQGHVKLVQASSLYTKLIDQTNLLMSS